MTLTRTRKPTVLATAIAVAGTVVLVRAAALEPVQVSSASMEPTLHVGSTVLVDKLSIHWRHLAPGDLVIFTSPDDGEDTVKRVVALAGQTVSLDDAVLHVDGVAVDEPQVDLSRIDGTYFGPVTVPQGSVFVLGDARDVSIDSRTYGAIPLRDVAGRVLATIPPR